MISAIITVDGAWLNTIKRKLAVPPPEVDQKSFQQCLCGENFQWMD